MAEPRRQTQSYLRGLFERRGIAPQHRYGQNFLIDLNIHELIVEAADVRPTDVVLEVGPGAGALTARLAEKAAAVVAVEIDPAMARLTAEAVAGAPNVRILNRDALAGKHELDPEVLDSIRAGLAEGPDRQFKLVANLPYNAATPIVGNLLVHPELCPARLVITIQRELAERMLAPAGTSDYSALSVLVQALAAAEVVRILPPTVFWPRPKVESAVVRIDPDPARRAALGDLPWFHAVIRKLFLHRRKNLRGALHAAWRERWDKPEVDALLGRLGLSGGVRAEDLAVAELIALADALRHQLGPDAPADPE